MRMAVSFTSMVDDRQDGGRRDRTSAPRRSGPDRARRAQPQKPPQRGAQRGRPDSRPRPADGADADTRSAPTIPASIEAKQLAPEIRAELLTLDKSTADTVARHLVAAGELMDSDPEAALAHAQAARTRSGRLAVIREAVGIAAYHCGDWAQALAEFRAARRMGSKSQLLPLIADCERGVGRPERAIELARSPEAAALTGMTPMNWWIAAAGCPHRSGAARPGAGGVGPRSPAPDRRAPDRRQPGCSTPTPTCCWPSTARAKRCSGSSMLPQPTPMV